MLARAFVADAVSDIVGRLIGREELWGVDPAVLAPAHDFVAAHRAPAFLEALADQCAKHGTGPDPPRRRLRAGRRDVPPLRRRQDPPGRRARAPHQRRRARGDHLRPRRDRRLRPLGAGGVRRVRDRRRVRLHRHGRRDRGAVAGLARHRRLARHPARDPHPGARRGRHRGAEADLAAAHRERRVDGRDHGHRARLRLGRRGREGRRDPDRRRLARERREDVGHVRGPRRRVDAARPHRSRQVEVAPRPLGDDRREAPRRGPLVRVRRRPGREDGRPRDRHDRLPRHALLRGRVRQLVRARREPHRRRGRPRPRLLLPDGRLRERPAADRGARRRPHAGRVRGGHGVRAGPQGLRQPGVRLPAVEGEARPHGVRSSRPAASSPTTSPARWPRARARSRRRW